MDSAQRREAIVERLGKATGPVRASLLGEELGVSRQIIVGDVALLRASGSPIRSTNRGYLLVKPKQLPRRCFHVNHSHADLDSTRTELGAVINAGGTVLDVSVTHEAYGNITADLMVRNQQDLDELMALLTPDSLLSKLTDGRHSHTIEAPDEATLDRVEEALRSTGFLESCDR